MNLVVPNTDRIKFTFHTNSHNMGMPEWGYKFFVKDSKG
jgi:hypothetical protein